MAAARSRRGLLVAFAGGLAAIALGSVARPAAGQVQSCNDDSQCPPNERCASSVCVSAVGPTSTPQANLLADPARCINACYSQADACSEACNGQAYFLRGRCWQICRSIQFYCVGSCPPPPQPQDDDSQDS
jgi:hypothetical protein